MMSSLPESREPAWTRLRDRLGDTGWTRARAIASLGMVFGVGAVGTMAAWSDTATASTGMFTTSAVNVQMKINDDRPVHNFVQLRKINMTRGATTAGTLDVKNTGSESFTYAMDITTADNGSADFTDGGADAKAQAFAKNLLVTIRKGGTLSGDTCGGGTVVGTADTALKIGSTPMIPTTGSLAVDDAEKLCVQVKLNPNAPKEARMSALSIAFKFTATKA